MMTLTKAAHVKRGRLFIFLSGSSWYREIPDLVCMGEDLGEIRIEARSSLKLVRLTIVKACNKISDWYILHF